ncbi:MAG: hypothetical protein JWM74_2688, partial [Myxococcaceae bacterium]|nr:hypothetical protein [Myxococcaceae bacterium]
MCPAAVLDKVSGMGNSIGRESQLPTTTPPRSTVLPFSRRSRAPRTSNPAIAATASAGAPASGVHASALFCDEADVVELVSESEIIDMDAGSSEDITSNAARDLPSVEVIIDEDPSVPAIAASGPVPTQDMFADDDPTVRLGALPPAPFPRHLSPSGSVPPPAIKKLGSALVPMEFLPSGASSSIAPLSMDSSRDDLASRREPTMKLRSQHAGDEPSIVIVRAGRPNILWGAALLAAGVLGGIVCSQLLVTPADDVVSNTPTTTVSTLAAAPKEATNPAHETAAASTVATHPTSRAHVEPTSAAPIEAARVASKPAPWTPPQAVVAAAPVAAPAPVAPAKPAGLAAKAPQAPAAAAPPPAAQASLAKKAPAPMVPTSTTPAAPAPTG